MCGILAIVNKNRGCKGADLQRACTVIRHRGPDDEGFLTWVPGEEPDIYAGEDTAASTLQHWKYDKLLQDASFKVGLGHRRLSIVDLSPTGHQPMRLSQAGLSIVFNGEIYNYPEIRKELEEIGHKFHSSGDTEVILHAWEEWGPECLNDFNGMFAFIILDEQKQELYAVRDRFGVKPLYYYENDDAIYFASEIKQIRTAPGYKFELNVPIARQYLALGATDHTTSTFEAGIQSVCQGSYIEIDLSKEKIELFESGWYYHDTHPHFRDFEEASALYRNTLSDAVNLRLRSDVKVGSCLSGGLDSSSIVCLAANLLKQKGDFAGQETVTACFNDLKYDEWKFAEEVIKKTDANPHKVFPSFGGLQETIDKLIWHQDQPFSSTSIFSQWAVFRKTNEVGLKVMIDGQGADEQLAGYGGHDLSMYAGLLHKMHLGELYDEALHYKKEKGRWPVGFLLGALQLNFGKWMMPAKYKLKAQPAIDWLSTPEPGQIYGGFIASDMVNFLRFQRKFQPLPALLRYEDHNSMAWSVESRTPFMDYRLVELSEHLPERYIVKHGVKKYILRHAMHGIIPEDIENRKDKMGFVTPEEMWLRGEGKEWFLENIDKACKQFGGTLLHAEKVKQYVSDILENRREFDSMPWRIVCFYKWYNQVNGL